MGRGSRQAAQRGERWVDIEQTHRRCALLNRHAGYGNRKYDAAGLLPQRELQPVIFLPGVKAIVGGKNDDGILMIRPLLQGIEVP